MKQRYPKDFLPFLFFYTVSAKAIAQTCAWKNVNTGAIGYLTELVFNPAQSNLLHARTGAGGAYRWYPTYNNMGTAYRFHGAG